MTERNHPSGDGPGNPAHEPRDLVIIGGGPAGLAAAWEATRIGLDYVVLERRGIGDTIARFPIGMPFYSDLAKLSLPGMTLSKPNYRKPEREEYLAALGQYAEDHRLHVRTWEEVVELTVTPDGPLFRIATRTGPDRLGSAVHTARFVLLATGSFDQPRGLGAEIPGLELAKVIHFVTEPYMFRGKDVLVVGGGNSAVESALTIYRTGGCVTIACRRPQLEPRVVKSWQLPDITNRIKEGSIRALFETTCKRIEPDRVVVESPSRGEFELPNDFVIVQTGVLPDQAFLARLGVPVGASGYPRHARPSFEVEGRPGLFVTGMLAGADIFVENSRISALEIVRRIAERLNERD